MDDEQDVVTYKEEKLFFYDLEDWLTVSEEQHLVGLFFINKKDHQIPELGEDSTGVSWVQTEAFVSYFVKILDLIGDDRQLVNRSS